MDEMNEIRMLGYCAECGDKITDEGAEYYCNDEGEYFCCIECVCDHHGITKIEI